MNDETAETVETVEAPPKPKSPTRIERRRIATYSPRSRVGLEADGWWKAGMVPRSEDERAWRWMDVLRVLGWPVRYDSGRARRWRRRFREWCDRAPRDRKEDQRYSYRDVRTRIWPSLRDTAAGDKRIKLPMPAAEIERRLDRMRRQILARNRVENA